jgi:hypothetical protein
MQKEIILNKFDYNNLFKIIFFLSFIDLLLFSIYRLSIALELSKTPQNFSISEFLLSNYLIFVLCSLGVFVLTIILAIIVPVNKFKIYITKNTFFWLLFILLISSIYIFFIQQSFRPRYESGSITTIAGLVRVLNNSLLIVLFIIYQLNRRLCNYKFFSIILLSSVLVIDGLSGAVLFVSLILFELYRLNLKAKIYTSILVALPLLFVLKTALDFKYGFENSFLEGVSGYSEYFYIYVIPRFSVHAEQLYSYISQDLDISNYIYLSKVITESFFNRLKVIFADGYDIFYPKTVAQSIVYDMYDSNVRGGSSPGYVLSVISFLPFTLPFIIILAFIFKQVSFRLNEQINFIQVASLCYIFKAISANLLDMLPIISPNFMTLVIAFLSSHVFLKHKELKKT